MAMDVLPLIRQPAIEAVPSWIFNPKSLLSSKMYPFARKLLLTAHRLIDPMLCGFPESLYGAPRQPDDFGDLVFAHSDEPLEVHDLAFILGQRVDRALKSRSIVERRTHRRPQPFTPVAADTSS
jgi:hypothetical protein